MWHEAPKPDPKSYDQVNAHLEHLHRTERQPMADEIAEECARLWATQYPNGVTPLLITEAIAETPDADLLFMFSLDDAAFGKAMRERIVGYHFAGIREQAETNVREWYERREEERTIYGLPPRSRSMCRFFDED